MNSTLEEGTEILPNEAVHNCLLDLISEKFPKQKYTYKVLEATQKGDNYIGVVYRIIIDLEAQNAGDPFSLILKVPPENLLRRKQFFARPCFLREALAYNEFLPMIMQFQSLKGINLKDGFHASAECYRAITAEMNEAIFMEDLQRKGYEMYNRFDTINVDYVRLVMHIYGKLHAISFAIKNQCVQRLQKFQQLEDIFAQRRQDYQLGAYFEELKKNTLSTFDEKKDKVYIQKLEQFFAKGLFFDLLLELIDGTKCEPYAVVCHGDCWNNNILFKHKEGKVVDACLIDWQIMRYASPITDLMYHLFTCTTKEFRNEHFQEMLDIYYTALTDYIERLGSSATTIFPKNAFQKEVQKFGASGLLMAMIVLPIATMKGEEAPNLEELSERIEAGGTTNLEGAGLLGQSNINAYKKRMRDTVIDCIEFGYI